MDVELPSLAKRNIRRHLVGGWRRALVGPFNQTWKVPPALPPSHTAYTFVRSFVEYEILRTTVAPKPEAGCVVVKKNR